MALTVLPTQQISTILNDAVANTLGLTTAEIDTTKILDYGTDIANAKAYSNFLNNLLVAICNTRFVNKSYQIKTPSLLVENEEYGQIRQVIRSKLDDAYNNQTFEVTDGASYDDNIFIKSDIEVTIFTENKTYEVRKSIYKKQLMNAFTSMDEMTNLISMLFNNVNNSLKIQDETLEKYAYSGAIAETIHQAYGSTALASTTKSNAINLLYEYNQTVVTPLTTSNCWKDNDFLTYCMERIKEVNDDMQEPGDDFQIKKVIPTWTDNARVVLNKKFNDYFNFRLRANTYNEDLLKFAKNIELINNWGLKGSFANKTTIKCKAQDSTSMNVPYVLGVVFEKYALIKQLHAPEIETKEIKSAQFSNYWFKQLVNFSFDPNENFTVFFVA